VISGGRGCEVYNPKKEKKMKKRFPTPMIVLLLLLFSLVVMPLVEPAAGDADKTGGVFAGIDDAKVLPMLKDLPHEHGGMNVPAVDGRLLYDLIIEKGYKRGLEIGTSNGYSTLWLGLAFRETGGKVITLEIDEDSGREAQANFRKARLDDVIDSRINDAFAEIPMIEGDFDFVFIDAWKPDYIKFLRLVRDRVVVGGAIAAHNVVSQTHHMKDFLYVIENDPDFETTIHESSQAGVSVSFIRKKSDNTDE
jgi:predicted O-methyltransferase YrrM